MEDFFLYYGREANPTLLKTLGSIAVEQAKETPQTEDEVHQFIDYGENHPKSKNNLSRQRHDNDNPQQRILLIRNQAPQQRRMAIIHGVQQF